MIVGSETGGAKNYERYCQSIDYRCIDLKAPIFLIAPPNFKRQKSNFKLKSKVFRDIQGERLGGWAAIWGVEVVYCGCVVF